jgi:high-affinity Fe2+/Pb2+ permease
MFSRKKKNQSLYYLLPSMGQANRRKYRKIVRWSIVFGLIFSSIFAYLVYRLNRIY